MGVFNTLWDYCYALIHLGSLVLLQTYNPEDKQFLSGSWSIKNLSALVAAIILFIPMLIIVDLIQWWQTTGCCKSPEALNSAFIVYRLLRLNKPVLPLISRGPDDVYKREHQPQPKGPGKVELNFDFEQTTEIEGIKQNTSSPRQFEFEPPARRANVKGASYSKDTWQYELNLYVHSSRVISLKLALMGTLALLGLVQACYFWRCDPNIFVTGEVDYIMSGYDSSLYYLYWDVRQVPNVVVILTTFFYCLSVLLNILDAVISLSVRRLVFNLEWLFNELMMPFPIVAIVTLFTAIGRYSTLGADSYCHWHAYALPLRMLCFYSQTRDFFCIERSLRMSRGSELGAVMLRSIAKFTALFCAFVVLVFFLEYDPIVDWTVSHSISGDPFSEENLPIAMSIMQKPHTGLLSNAYYTTITFSTIGYGDWSPITPLGRVLVLVFVAFALVVIPGILNDIEAARSRSILQGKMPYSKELGNTILCVGPIQTSTACAMLHYINAQNHAATLKDRTCGIVFSLPAHAYKEVTSVALPLSRILQIRCAFIKGDIGFGSEDRARVLKRLRIAKWINVREIYVFSDFQSVGDVHRESRMTISRLASIQNNLKSSLTNQKPNLVKAVVFNHHDARRMSHYCGGEVIVLSRLKARMIAASVLHSRGFAMLMGQLFNAALAVRSSTPVGGNALRYYGWDWSLRTISLTRIFDIETVVYYRTLHYVLWILYRIRLVGAVSIEEHGKALINPLCGTNLQLDPVIHDVVVICRPADLCRNRDCDKLRICIDKLGGINPKGPGGSRFLDPAVVFSGSLGIGEDELHKATSRRLQSNHLWERAAVRAFTDDQDDQVEYCQYNKPRRLSALAQDNCDDGPRRLSLSALAQDNCDDGEQHGPESVEYTYSETTSLTDGRSSPQVNMNRALRRRQKAHRGTAANIDWSKYDHKDLDGNFRPFGEPTRPMVVVFGYCKGFHELLFELVAEPGVNVLWLTCEAEPDLRKDCMDRASHECCLRISRGQNVDEVSVAEAIKFDAHIASHLILLPYGLIDEEEENADESLVDTHVFSTREMIKDLLIEGGLTIPLLFNLEVPGNLPFFSRGHEWENVTHTIYDADEVVEGNVYADGMEESLAFSSHRANPTCVNAPTIQGLMYHNGSGPILKAIEATEEGKDFGSLYLQRAISRHQTVLGVYTNDDNGKSQCLPATADGYIMEKGDKIYILEAPEIDIIEWSRKSHPSLFYRHLPTSR